MEMINGEVVSEDESLHPQIQKPVLENCPQRLP